MYYVKNRRPSKDEAGYMIEQEAEFDAIRARNENNIKKQHLARRRTLQAALMAQTQSHGSGADSPKNHSETQVNPTTPSTTHATVGVNSFAGAHDPLAQELEEDERQWQEHITWLTQRCPGRDFSTLDLDELEQLRREFGPGPTLEQDHNQYLNVHVEPRVSAASQASSRHPSQGDSQSHRPPANLSIEAELGVNPSFNQPRVRLQSTALVTRPVPRQQATSRSRPALLSHQARNRHVEKPSLQRPATQPTPPTTPSSNTRRTDPPGLPHMPGRNVPLCPHTQPGAVHPRPPALPANHAPRPMRPTPEDVEPDKADLELVAHAIGGRLRTHVPGDKPRCTEWHGMVLKLVDRAAADSKATLLASGFMKTAEERELIINQAWRRANEYFNQPHPHRKIMSRQVRYIQNLFSPCRKLMKTRLETLVPAVHHLHDGTHEQIAEHANKLLPHAFHSHARAGELGPLHFEHWSLSAAIALLIFRDPKDLGVTFNTLFNPIPARLLAFVCAMIADIISEHSTGTHVSKPTRIETLRPLFNTYISSLGNLQDANAGRFRNLLMRLHDECFAASKTLQEVAFEEPNNVIPVEQFDPTQVEPYQPRYTADQLRAAMTQAQIVDEDAQDLSEDEETDTEMAYGEAGPGPSTLRNRQAIAMEDDRFNWEDYKADDDMDGGMDVE
ncbi:hypothetical protein FRC10_000246 [Ceratobasidium sp. 414]|nr:hypothetical protein FRC10_000246 [Ceratobasidium sp. 414]